MSQFLEVHANENDMPVVQRLVATLEAFASELTGDVRIGEAAYCIHIKPPVDPLEVEGQIVQTTTGNELYVYRKNEFPPRNSGGCVLYQQGEKQKIGWVKGDALKNGNSVVIEQPYVILGTLSKLHQLDATPLDLFLHSFRSFRKARYGDNDEVERLYSDAD
jgi:hypothetical protein